VRGPQWPVIGNGLGGGFAPNAAAIGARNALLSRSREESTTVLWTVAKWLRFWLSTRRSIRPSTLRAYTEHVDNHLIHYKGSVRLIELPAPRRPQAQVWTEHRARE
jgi:hypothetical protein